MDFALSEEEQMFQELFRDFAQNEVKPLADAIDREERTPTETLKKMAEMELLGLPFPPEYGGAGVGLLGNSLLLEELGKVCLATANIVAVHTGVAANVIYLGGTEEQKKKYLTPLARGEKIGSFCLTEPGVGSDAAKVEAMAVKKDGHYLLRGSKIWITNAEIAEIFTVFAKTDREAGARGITAFIVERGMAGFKIGRRERKMGIRGCPTNQLFFDDCPVPEENILGGEEGKGLAIALKTLDYGRLGIGAISLGAAEGALVASIEFAQSREQFGGPIAQKQAIQWMIADMATDIEALRFLVYRTAWMADQGQPFRREAAMTKLFASEVAYRATNKAVQLHGGAGYVRDLPIERMYRDARITRIYEGTSEIQRFIIASDIFGKEGLKLRP